MAKLRKRAWLKLSEAAEMLSNLTGEMITFNDLLRYAEDGALTLSLYFLEPVPVHAKNYKVHDEPELPVSTWERLRHEPDRTLYKKGPNNEFPHQISGLWEIYPTDTAKLFCVHGAEASSETAILTKAIPEITSYSENAPRWRYFHLFSIGMNQVQTANIHHQDIAENTLVCIRPEMIEQIIDRGDDTTAATGQPADELEALPSNFSALYESMGAGDLPHLEILIAAWVKFWRDRSPDDGKGRYPDNGEVAEWARKLMDKPEKGNSKAKAIASIIRPTWAPIGRQSNDNQ